MSTCLLRARPASTARGRQLRSQQLQVHHHRIDRVLHLVPHARGQPPDRRQPARYLQLLLQFAAPMPYPAASAASPSPSDSAAASRSAILDPVQRNLHLAPILQHHHLACDTAVPMSNATQHRLPERRLRRKHLLQPSCPPARLPPADTLSGTKYATASDTITARRSAVNSSTPSRSVSSIWFRFACSAVYPASRLRISRPAGRSSGSPAPADRTAPPAAAARLRRRSRPRPASTAPAARRSPATVAAQPPKAAPPPAIEISTASSANHSAARSHGSYAFRKNVDRTPTCTTRNGTPFRSSGSRNIQHPRLSKHLPQLVRKGFRPAAPQSSAAYGAGWFSVSGSVLRPA